MRKYLVAAILLASVSFANAQNTNGLPRAGIVGDPVVEVCPNPVPWSVLLAIAIASGTNINPASDTLNTNLATVGFLAGRDYDQLWVDIEGDKVYLGFALSDCYLGELELDQDTFDVFNGNRH
jgi:hypothetical protein